MLLPYVICHNLVTIDGKSTGSFINSPKGRFALKLYQEIHDSFNADGFILGRNTIEEYFTHNYEPDFSKYCSIDVSYTDCVIDSTNGYYLFCFDEKGKLGWKSGYFNKIFKPLEKVHVVEVLTTKAKPEYLAYLKDIGVSYIFAGDDLIDINLALNKMKTLFNVNTILLEGGPKLNGAFAELKIINEYNFVVAPLMGKDNDVNVFNNIPGDELTKIYRQDFKDGTILARFAKR